MDIVAMTADRIETAARADMSLREWIARSMILSDDRLDCLFGDDEQIDRHALRGADQALATVIEWLRVEGMDALVDFDLTTHNAYNLVRAHLAAAQEQQP